MALLADPLKTNFGRNLKQQCFFQLSDLYISETTSTRVTKFGTWNIYAWSTFQKRKNGKDVRHRDGSTAPRIWPIEKSCFFQCLL